MEAALLESCKLDVYICSAIPIGQFYLWDLVQAF